MTCIIDVGGGMRDIYGAGILDYCLDRGITFDRAVGVSAGSANLASFKARQRGRAYRFYIDFAFRPEYMGWRNMLQTGQYLNTDYAYGTLSAAEGECPLDYTAYAANRMAMTVVATDAVSGAPLYFTDGDVSQDDYRIMCASSTVPLACQAYAIRGHLCYDGGMSDPIPLLHAMELGADRIVLILTRPADTRRDPKKDELIVKGLRRRHPKAAEAMARRAVTYNGGVELAKTLAARGKLLLLAPDDIGGMGTLTRDREKLEQLYQKGYHDAERLPAFLGL